MIIKITDAQKIILLDTLTRTFFLLEWQKTIKKGWDY